MRGPSPAVRVALEVVGLTALVLVVIQLSGAVAPVELLAAGQDGFGGRTMVEDFGADAIREGVPFDGQYIYVTARAIPDLDQVSHADESSFRLVRILHPLLASPGGQGNAVIWLLQAWTLVGLGLFTWALADLLTRAGHSPRWAIAAGPAAVMPLILTTSEPLAFGLAMAGLAVVLRERYVLGTVLLALGGLTRESALTVAIATGAVLWTRAERRAAVGVTLAAAAPLAAWWAYIQSITPRSRVPLEPLGLLQVLDQWGPDVVASVITLGLLVVAVRAWRDVPPLWWVAIGFLAWVPLYEPVAFKLVGLPRLSMPALALGFAGLGRWRSERRGEPSVVTSSPPVGD